MPPRQIGIIIDSDGFPLEVWAEFFPTPDEPSHIWVCFEGSQLADFPFRQPNTGCEICEAAQLITVSNGEIDHVDVRGNDHTIDTLDDDDGGVIDLKDTRQMREGFVHLKHSARLSN
jgi:hypothetical protein